jgi:uncharacterized protein (DUF342 family)
MSDTPANPTHDPQGRGVTVRVSPDRETATLCVVPDAVGDPMLDSAVTAAVGAAGVDLTRAVRERIADALRQATPGQPIQAVIASATPPVHGQPGGVEWLVDSPEFDRLQRDRRDACPDLPEDPEPAQASHYERCRFVIVEAGDRIGVLHPPVQGTDGRDVLGKTLAARKGVDAPLRLDDSITRADDGSLLAFNSGVLIREDGKAHIDDRIEIPGYVDFSTGNIHFGGEVLVHRGVRDRFTVHARQVEVRGLIEAATIITDDGLKALGGFAGRERGSANVGGTLEAKYLDNVEGEIGGDLSFDREALNCDLVVHGRVRSPHGSIIGGRLLVTGACTLGHAGSGAGVRTVLVLGAVPRLDPLRDRLEPIVADLRDQRQRLEQEQARLDKLTQGNRLTPTDRERQTEMMFEANELDRLLAKASPALDRLVAEIEATRRVELTIEGRLHPGVEIVCDATAYRVEDRVKGPCTICPQGGTLMLRRGEDEPIKLTDVCSVHAADRLDRPDDGPSRGSAAHGKAA